MIANLKNEDQHQHSNGRGWVANTARVADSVFVGEHALVYGQAELTGNVRVMDAAQVSGTAKLSGNVLLYGNAWVDKGSFTGNTRIHINARVATKQERVK